MYSISIQFKVRALPPDRTEVGIKGILDQLRLEIGDSEFGYRMQALFAHVIGRLGARVIEVNAQGHPDLRVNLAGQDLLFQVKTSRHGSWATSFSLEGNDLAGITPTKRTGGFLAFLDCAEPVNWILVPYDRIRLLLGQAVHVPTLVAERDPVFSEECNVEFVEMLQSVGPRLQLLTFSALRHRALSGDFL